MTFNPAPWAVDGARINSALARLASDAALGGAEGVVNSPDLKVSQLAVAGNGLLISGGAAIILNRYQTTPNEVYVVSNVEAHTITSGTMPASNPSTKYYLVCVTVGDPEFSQIGHPWMGSGDPPDGEAETFEYVRPWLVECTSTTKSFADLGLDYPALALARIAVPPSTTTITNAMITDLRKLARPRQSQEVRISPSGTWNSLTVNIPNGSSYADWGTSQYLPTVDVPSWAKRAILLVNVNGVKVLDTSVNIAGGIRTQFGSVTGPSTAFDLPIASGAVRLNLQTAGEYDVSALAGTSASLRVEAYESVPASPSADQKLRLTTGSQMIFDIRFFEE